MFKKDFLKASQKASGMSDSAFIDAILVERPDLAGKMTYIPGQGACAHTVMIGDEVFKAVRSSGKWTQERFQYFAEGIERERDILQLLNDKGLPVPELTCKGKALPFFGMTRLSGQELTPDDIEKMSKAEKESLAREIAVLCVDLSRAVPAAAAKKLGADKPLPGVSFTPESLQAALANPEVCGALGDNEAFFRQKVREYTAMHHKKYAGHAPCFMHADMSPGNMLYDPQTKKLSGFIDFGVSRLAFPDEGLGTLCMTYPDDFSRMVLKEYSRLQPVPVTREDMKLWECAYAVNRFAELARTKPEGWEERVNRSANGVRETVDPSRTQKLSPPQPSTPKNS